MKTYKIWKDGEIVRSPYPGMYAGITTQKVFGLSHCCGGQRANAENRIWFWFYDDAVKAGYRPCKLCKPDEQRPRHTRKRCTHRSDRSGDMTVYLEKLRIRYRVTCTRCDRMLGYARERCKGVITWKDEVFFDHANLRRIDEE